jgi:hypothetical protein
MTVELELQNRPIALYVIIVALIAATAIKMIFFCHTLIRQKPSINDSMS